jgi:hypothetical protein
MIAYIERLLPYAIAIQITSIGQPGSFTVTDVAYGLYNHAH